MVTRGKTLPVRKPERSDESLLLRSAESLGRMIGRLQRQLDEATRRLSEFGDESEQAGPAMAAPAPPRVSRRPQAASATKGSGTRSAKHTAAPHTIRAKSSGARTTTRKNGAAATTRSRKSAKKKAPSR